MRFFSIVEAVFVGSY